MTWQTVQTHHCKVNIWGHSWWLCASRGPLPLATGVCAFQVTSLHSFTAVIYLNWFNWLTDEPSLFYIEWLYVLARVEDLQMWPHHRSLRFQRNLLITVSNTCNNKTRSNSTWRKLLAFFLQQRSVSNLHLHGWLSLISGILCNPPDAGGQNFWILQGLQMWPHWKSVHFQKKWQHYTVVVCLPPNVHTAMHFAGLQNFHHSAVKKVLLLLSKWGLHPVLYVCCMMQLFIEMHTWATQGLTIMSWPWLPLVAKYLLSLGSILLSPFKGSCITALGLGCP